MTLFQLHTSVIRHNATIVKLTYKIHWNLKRVKQGPVVNVQPGISMLPLSKIMRTKGFEGNCGLCTVALCNNVAQRNNDIGF